VGVEVVEATGLRPHDLTDTAEQLRVPGAAETDGLREDRRLPEPGDAVEGLGAGAEGRQAEAIDLRLPLVHERDLLLEREPGDEVLDALLEWDVRVPEGRVVHRGARRGGRRREQQCAQRARHPGSEWSAAPWRPVVRHCTFPLCLAGPRRAGRPRAPCTRHGTTSSKRFGCRSASHPMNRVTPRSRDREKPDRASLRVRPSGSYGRNHRIEALLRTGESMAATINDVARVAGVSISTVSYALSGKRPIGEKTRRRVEAAIAELGYTPNAGARALAGRRTYILAVTEPVRPDTYTPAHMAFVLATATAARAYDYDVLLLTQDESLGGLQRVTTSRIVDGIIVLDVLAQDERAELVRAMGVPAALVGIPDDTEGLACVDLDFGAAAELAVDRLADAGHRVVGLLGHPETV